MSLMGIDEGGVTDAKQIIFGCGLLSGIMG